MLPQDNSVPETVYEAKQIICLLGLEVEKIHRARMIALYIVGRSMKTLRNTLFVDLTDSIVGKMALMTTIATKERAGLKRCFVSFLSFLV
jgi:hypothetical protein